MQTKSASTPNLSRAPKLATNVICANSTNRSGGSPQSNGANAASTLTVADVDALISARLAKERAVVVGEIADCLYEALQKQRERADALTEEVRTLRTCFEALTRAIDRNTDATSAKIIDLPSLNDLRRAH
jgi:hypothetical protein